MSKTIFLSHNAKDKALAMTISNIIRQVSIAQIETWFSSDDSATGGFNPGDDWYGEILRKVNECDILIVLLTPNSLNRAWIYYEAGIAKGVNKTVVPICVGIKRADIKSPLNVFQAYQLTDKSSFEEFLDKILNYLGFPLDKLNFEKPIKEAIVKITTHAFDINDAKKLSVEEILENLKSHMDQKFALFSNHSNDKSKKELISNFESYSIKFKLDFDKDQREFLTEIKDQDTFQTVTNNIYFNFMDIMHPFTYLEKWVIIDNETKSHLIIREIANRILAKGVFIRDREYIIKKLDKPYNALESKDRL